MGGRGGIGLACDGTLDGAGSRDGALDGATDEAHGTANWLRYEANKTFTNAHSSAFGALFLGAFVRLRHDAGHSIKDAFGQSDASIANTTDDILWILMLLS